MQIKCKHHNWFITGLRMFKVTGIRIQLLEHQQRLQGPAPTNSMVIGLVLTVEGLLSNQLSKNIKCNIWLMPMHMDHVRILFRILPQLPSVCQESLPQDGTSCQTGLHHPCTSLWWSQQPSTSYQMETRYPCSQDEWSHEPWDTCRPKLPHSFDGQSQWPGFHSWSKLHFPSTCQGRSQWRCKHHQQGFPCHGSCHLQHWKCGIIHHREHPPPHSCYGETQWPSPNYCMGSDYPSLHYGLTQKPCLANGTLLIACIPLGSHQDSVVAPTARTTDNLSSNPRPDPEEATLPPQELSEHLRRLPQAPDIE